MVRVPTPSNRHGAWRRVVALVAVAAAILAACSVPAPSRPGAQDGPAPAHATGSGRGSGRDDGATADRHLGSVTLAFAGDMHFQLHLAALLDHPHGALGPITRSLGNADLTMVNLETSISHRGEPEAKELETPDDRYYYRTSPAALDVLAAAGVDVVTMANNHAADYGPLGLQDTLRAIRHSPVHVVGIGVNRRAAFTPYRVSVRGTTLAFFGADASFREGSSSVWAAGPRSAGIAAAHAAPPRALLGAVRTASRTTDVVVVYMHWGKELQGCSTAQQRAIARALALAGADVVVGAHAHVLLGSGWVGDTYVDYGLANFLWYHNNEPQSGVLRLRIESGHVVGDRWVPALLGTYGRPHPLTGAARAAAIDDWRRLRACSGLAPRPSS